MTAISNRTPPVAVEYDGRGGVRATKSFVNCFEARRFFASKNRDGKNPKVRRVKMSRKNRGGDGGVATVVEQEPKTQAQEGTELTDAQMVVAGKCDDLKECLKQASVLYCELELIGQAKRLRTEHDKMGERKARLVKRVGRSGSREEREANKNAKKAERIAKLREQLAKLTEE